MEFLEKWDFSIVNTSVLKYKNSKSFSTSAPHHPQYEQNGICKMLFMPNKELHGLGGNCFFLEDEMQGTVVVGEEPAFFVYFLVSSDKIYHFFYDHHSTHINRDICTLSL